MTYKIEGKYYELNNEDMMEVRKNQREFDLSEEDAVRMFFEDWEYIPAGSKVKIERVKDIQTKKEYAKSDKPRKTSTKERKVDETKKRFLNGFRAYLEDCGCEIVNLKTETELTFNFEDEQYTVKLTKHRKKG
jgi:hypothetical protein